MDALDCLMALCAAPTWLLDDCSDAVAAEPAVAAGPAIAASAAAVSDWQDAPERAETHGMAPLLYRQLKACGAPAPRETVRALQGLVLRHRLASQARSSALAELLACAQRGGARVLVLKGAALAQVLYPEPGLRPMNDIDLLVSARDLPAVQRALQEAGFQMPAASPKFAAHRHIPPAEKNVAGFSVSVEVHHHLYQDDAGRSWGRLEDLANAPLAFDLPVGEGVCRAETLSREDMLYHLCRQPFNDGGFGRLRWIWAADVTGFAVRFRDEIDWDQVRRRFPEALVTLALLDALTPLPEPLRGRVPLPAVGRPHGAGEPYRGWPHRPFTGHSHPDRWSLARDTLFPPPWWLALRYARGGPLLGVRARLAHYGHILSLVQRRLKPGD